MKKTLLFCAAALFTLMASASDGLVAVGAQMILAPSSRWDNDMRWKAWTWVYRSLALSGDPNEATYGDWNSWNPNYNQVLSEPSEDAEGRKWFEPGFDMGPKLDEDGESLDYNLDYDMPIVWEEQWAPYSSDEYYDPDGDGIQPAQLSYQWTGSSIMADIYVRRVVTVPVGEQLSGVVFLTCGHDDAPAEYYINGVKVFERTGFEGEHEREDGNIEYANAWNNNEYIQLTDEQKALIKLNGEENIIAFHVHQNWGGAFADCGLYAMKEGGLEMGYTIPWEGKVLFNNYGGYNWDGKEPSNNPRHPWSRLYEAQEGDVYSFTLNGSCPENLLDRALSDRHYDYMDKDSIADDLTWKEQLHFKTPIRIEEGHDYNFKMRLKADKPFTAVIVKLTDNDYDKFELAYEDVTIDAPEEGNEDSYEGTLVDVEFEGIDSVYNFKIALDFGGGQDTTKVTISDISLVDLTEEKELWVGTHYFNFFDMSKPVLTPLVWDPEIENSEGGMGDYRDATKEEIAEGEFTGYEITRQVIDAPEMTGRTETLAWTQADFDDSMWDSQMMPVGSADYTYRASAWPGGDNTNYWIRRNFELEKINERLSYYLNVCHDDVYETYVNGHLLQKNTHWTDGKNPVQVRIPAKYLNVGKNVIATYIQQNWGGRFYDCGINVVEVNFEECAQKLKDAIAEAETESEYVLTNAMRDSVQAHIADAKYQLANNKDAADLKDLATELTLFIRKYFAYSPDVKTLKDTYEICHKMDDAGYWGTTLDDAAAALDTCQTASQLTPYLDNLRNARKATAMERHTEKYVGCIPETVSMDKTGENAVDTYWDPDVPKYYIYNVGAKCFLGGGETWGAHLALEYISNAMMIIQAEKDVIDPDTGDNLLDDDGYPVTEPIEGAYFIESFRPNGDMGYMDFVGWNGYIDVGMGNNLWEFIPVEGKENVFNIAQYGQTFGAADTTCYNGTIFEPGGKKLLGLRSGDNRYAPSYYVVDTDMRSPDLETNQWMFISREELLGLIPTASETNPVDLTFLIDNPGYDQRWSIDNWVFYNGQVFGRYDGSEEAWKHYDFVLESYNTQEFSNTTDLWPNEGEDALPAGTYLLEVQGYYRDGIEQAHFDKLLAGQPIHQNALIFAGSTAEDLETCETIPLMPIHIDANKYPGIGFTDKSKQYRVPGSYGGQPYAACDQAGRDYFPCGLYKNRLAFVIPEDDPGHLSIGINKPFVDDKYYPNGDWIVMDNWRLKYYGKDADPDEIKGITTDEIKTTAKASTGIYNMLGQRLSKTQKGLNIVGGKKILKK